MIIKRSNHAFSIPKEDLIIKLAFSFTQGWGEGGKRGLGPRNDVLATCKAATLRSGQRIIAGFSQNKYFISEKRAVQ